MAQVIARLRARARAMGFDAVGIVDARLPGETARRLRKFLDEGRHGTMTWMETRSQERCSPDALWPQARSAIVLALNYGPRIDPLRRLEERSTGVISVYALNRDYHDVVKGRLKELAGWFAGRTGHDVKVFVDTAPVMEKPLAERAGVGWQGKHTNLVSRNFGSWLFLGLILTTARLRADAAEADHCGTCRACLDICPTDAFPAPYQLDARRCISYLTIEHKGHIDRQFRSAIGNRIYGCDDCLAVCPWNKFALVASETRLKARSDLEAPPLAQLAQLDNRGFRQMFSGSPIKRTGRDRFVRNVMIAIGNSGNPSLARHARQGLRDSSALVRAMAVWALSRLCSKGEFEEIRTESVSGENDPDVLDEWRQAHL